MTGLRSTLEAAGVHVQPYNENGPAAAQTAPSHGSTNPEKEKDMNDITNITSPRDEARLTLTIDKAKLATLTMDELLPLYQAIHHATETLSGLANQSRFSKDDVEIFTYNGAGDRLEELLEWLGWHQQIIYETAEAAEIDDPKEAEKRAWLMLQYHSNMCDVLPDLAALAASLTARQSHVERKARHIARAVA